MTPDQPHNTQKKIVAGSVIAIIVIALLVAITAHEMNGNKPAANDTVVTQAQVDTGSATASDSSSSASTGSYKDGTYTATNDYIVPSGNESITVKLTVKNNVVTDSEITNSENDRDSAEFQESFADEYKSEVVGKNVGSVQLSFVAGASDTTDAFNQAVQDIANQAKA